MIVSSNITRDYTIIPNSLLTSPHVDSDAKIIWLTLREKGKNWCVYNEALARELKISVTTLKKYINQLISFGWLSRIDRRSSSWQFKGGYDYILHSTPKLLTDCVDNSTNYSTFADSFLPDPKKLAPNQKLNLNNNQINNKQDVILSSNVESVDKLNSISELELEAAHSYVNNQRMVRDRDAYLACTIKNGWHQQIYEALKDKLAYKQSQTQLSKAKNKFKSLDHSLHLNLHASIHKNLQHLRIEPQKNKLVSNSDIDGLISAASGTSQSNDCISMFVELKWYYWQQINFPELIDKPEFPTIGHTKAYEIAKQLAEFADYGGLNESIY